MNSKIKNFIEKYINLIDQDLTGFFYQCWEHQELSRADIAYMASMFMDAGIKSVDVHRHEALMEVLDLLIGEFSNKQAGVSAMPVFDFIDAFVDNGIGYESNYIFLTITKNKDRWSNQVNIYLDKQDNLTIMEVVW